MQTTFCSNGSVILTSSIATGNQWYKDGVLINGATNATFTATESGDYLVTATNGVCGGSSSVITITVLAATTSTTNASICSSAVPYSWNSINYSAAGSYTLHFTNATGCDSAATLNLSITNCNVPCLAGTTSPCLSTSYVCLGTSTTYDLTTVTLTCTKPAGTVLEWHTGNPATAVNLINNATAATLGTYWAVYHDTANSCYGNNGFATQNLRVDTCSSNVTSGVGGGVESKTLGDVIAVRLYGNAINSVSTTANTGVQFANSGAIVNGANNLKLSDLVPVTVANTDAAYVTTPTDLVNFTNAVEVLAVDYSKGNSTKAVAFGTKTLGDVYSHTKPICDRLKGAELLEVKNINVNGFNLMAYKVHQRTGETEYAINLSAGTATNRNSISLQSNWFTDSYQQDEKLYNFQLWAVSYEMVTAMATDIISKLQANGTVNTVTNADLPKAYISKGSRVNTNLTVTVQNNTTNTTGYFELREKANENSQVSTRQVPFTATANGISNITIPVKDNYEGNIYVYLNNKLTDLVYLSDGTWALDYNKNTTSISKFDVTNEANPTTTANEHRLFRNVAVTGASKDYITVYKTMMGGGLEQNVSSYKSLLFNANASGAGSVTVTLVKKSITDWKNQYTYTVSLDGNKEYGINLNQFTSTKFNSAINANDIVAVNFSFNNSRGVPTNMSINLSKARFAATSVATNISVNAIGVYPNPTMGKFTASFTSTAAQPLVLKVVEIATGKTVKTQFINAAKGNNQVAVDNNLASGLYIVTLEGDSDKYNAAKLMVNKK